MARANARRMTAAYLVSPVTRHAGFTHFVLHGCIESQPYGSQQSPTTTSCHTILADRFKLFRPFHETSSLLLPCHPRCYQRRGLARYRPTTSHAFTMLLARRLVQMSNNSAKNDGSYEYRGGMASERATAGAGLWRYLCVEQACCGEEHGLSRNHRSILFSGEHFRHGMSGESFYGSGLEVELGINLPSPQFSMSSDMDCESPNRKMTMSVKRTKTC